APWITQGDAPWLFSDRNTRALGARGDRGQMVCVAEYDLDPIKASHAFGALTGGARVPDVACNLVVIATAAVEACAGIINGSIKTEGVAVEPVGFYRVTHLQVDMAYTAVLRISCPLRIASGPSR